MYSSITCVTGKERNALESKGKLIEWKLIWQMLKLPVEMTTNIILALDKFVYHPSS
jgi:hypothetical protein